MDFAEAIDTATVEKPPAAKKSNCPVLDNGSDEVKKAVDSVVTEKANIKKSGAIIKKGEAVIFDYVQPIQDNDGFEMRHSKSYEVVGNDETVKYVTQDRFICNIKDVDNLKEIYGKEGFDKRFEIDQNITAKKDIFTDEAKQKKLMELMTDPKVGNMFSEFFEVTKTLKTKKGHDVLQFENEDTLEDARVFVKQYKAALR